jgi:hypothetical protein
MTTITMKNEYGVDYESTVFAKRGVYDYSVGLSEPHRVMIARSVEVEGAQRVLANGYYFPADSMDQAVGEFFTTHNLPTDALLDRVKELANQYFASTDALEILIAMPVQEETPFTEVPAEEPVVE